QAARAQAADPPPPVDQTGRAAPAAGNLPAATAGNAPPAAGSRRLPSNIEKLEISAPVLMQSTTVIARIGKSEVILAGDIMPQVELLFKQMSSHYDPAQHETLREHLLRQILEDVIKRKLIVADMKKSVPSDKRADYDKQLNEVLDKRVLPDILKRKKLKNESELAAVLEKEGMSLEAFKRDQIELALVSEWMKHEAEDDSEVTHDQMLRYYHEHFDEYKYPAKARFEVLHASFKKHRDRQEAWRLICQLGNEVVRGRPLAEVAKARSEGLHADRGGAWDWTTKGSLRSKVLDTAVFSLPAGHLSDVLEDTSGYSIVRVVERQEAGVKSFRETQAEIRTKIKADRGEKHRNEALAKLLEKRTPTVWTIFDDQPVEQQVAEPRRRSVRR
ncbi:MAG TPA: peptidyl-prolyl cis-trans isomerase, partial [Pirellulales bacterium]|nr:peptidyl-prolyl cis-trans isomerase [Pirellulales bacterium]